MIEIPIIELPKKISPFDAVEQCYQEQLRFAFNRLKEDISVIIRCEKMIIPYLQMILKRRLASEGKTTVVIDGTTDSDELKTGRLGNIVVQLRGLINNTETNKVFFLPYLDIVTSTTQSSLTGDAKEIMTIIHENPMLTFVAFEDPEFAIPDLIAQAFPAKYEMLGIPRNHISKIITEIEARKFAVDKINMMGIYKYVSGLNPVRFREIMGIFSQKADYDPQIHNMLSSYLKELRSYTTCSTTSLSDIDLEKDIAGYTKVKEKIRLNILNMLQETAKLTDEKQIKQIESIIPRGLILFGPPGTGKTLFAKGIAEALNAAIYIVNGPELKSKWVGEGEANIRRLFSRARSTAPSVIVFDEMDSIAASRSDSGSSSASTSAHSMVNQLLTEMDGFNKEQMVLIIGTTNFVESLDPAFLRPGRFEYQIEIPYPEWEDRKAILSLYNKKFDTGLNEEQLIKLVDWTKRPTALNTPYTGDHLSAMIKDLKRYLINNSATSATEDILEVWLKTKGKEAVLTPEEETVVALHESGHALMYFCYKRESEIGRITLESGGTDALGYVERKREKEKNVITEKYLKSEIGIALGGYCAEKLFLGETSVGASADLRKVTRIATDMVSFYGMGELPREYSGPNGAPDPVFLHSISPQVDKIISESLNECRNFLEKNPARLKLLVATLRKERTLTNARVKELMGVADD